MDEVDGVVGEHGVGPSGEFQVLADVAGGLDAGHGWHGVSEADALIERGERAELDASA